MKTQNNEKGLATEICAELKRSAFKWRTAFFVLLVIEVLTVITSVQIIR